MYLEKNLENGTITFVRGIGSDNASINVPIAEFVATITDDATIVNAIVDARDKTIGIRMRVADGIWKVQKWVDPDWVDTGFEEPL